MLIRHLVQALFARGGPSLHDDNGVAIAPERLRREYEGIRAWLLEELEDGEPVAVSLPRDYRFVLSILACLETARPWIPLKPAWPASRIKQLSGATGFTRILDEEAAAAALRRPGSARPLPGAGPDAAAYIISTSGSTGAPKAAVISRRAYENFLSNLAALCEPLPKDCRHLLIADFTFDMCLIDIGLLLLKKPAFFISRFEGDIFQLAYEIQAWRITGASSVPNTFGLLLREAVRSRCDLSALSLAILGGAPMTPRVYGDLFRFFPNGLRALHIYGPTETTVFTHAKRLTGSSLQDSIDGVYSIGRPLPGVACRLRGADGRLVAGPEGRGELLIGGVQLMTGYAGEAVSSRLVEIEGERYFASQDLAFADQRGEHFIVGRTGDTIKRRGCRVNLAEIDARVRAMDLVDDCATLAYPDRDRDHVLVTCMTLSRPASEKEVRRRLAEQLLPHEMPDLIEILERLPIGETGKISRAVLQERFDPRKGDRG